MKAILIGILLMVVVPLMGQVQDVADPQSPPELVIKSDIIQWLSPFKQSVGIQMDYRFMPHHRFDMMAGFYMGSRLYAYRSGESYQGPRIRIGWKFAFLEKRVVSMYTGLEFGFDDITHRYYGTVQRQGGNYTEELLRNRHLTSLSGALRFGVMVFIGPSRRLMIEPEIKTGISQHNVIYKDPPDVVTFEINRGIFDFQSPVGKTITFLPSIGFHIGYVLFQ